MYRLRPGDLERVDFFWRWTRPDFLPGLLKDPATLNHACTELEQYAAMASLDQELFI